MKPKMKKNPEFRKFRPISTDDDTSGIGYDKKTAHRRERRVFNPNNIKRYYIDRVQPALEEEEAEQEKEEYNERGEYDDASEDK
jgi:hypothetical protein